MQQKLSPLPVFSSRRWIGASTATVWTCGGLWGEAGACPTQAVVQQPQLYELCSRSIPQHAGEDCGVGISSLVVLNVDSQGAVHFRGSSPRQYWPVQHITCAGASRVRARLGLCLPLLFVPQNGSGEKRMRDAGDGEKGLEAGETKQHMTRKCPLSVLRSFFPNRAPNLAEVWHLTNPQICLSLLFHRSVPELRSVMDEMLLPPRHTYYTVGTTGESGT